MSTNDQTPAAQAVEVAPAGDLDGLLADAARVAGQARASNTSRAYDSDWRRFVTWCATRDLSPLPASPETVVAYLMDAARAAPGQVPRYKVSTLARWVTTINVAHRDAGHAKPGEHAAVRHFLAGMAREHGVRPRRVAPLLLDDVKTVVAHMDPTVWPAGVAAIRDTAIMLAAFAGAFRRSELAALDLRDVTFDRADGVHLLVRRSKTDQSGEGQVKPAPFGQAPESCVPCALARWLAVLAAAHFAGRAGEPQRVPVMKTVFAADPGIHICRGDRINPDPDSHGPLTGALLRPINRHGTVGPGRMSGDAIRGVIKRRVAAAGLDPAEFSGHSPRAGFVTEALRRGADPHSIMRQTGHRDPATIEVYARERAPMEGNAVRDLGL